MVCIGCTSVVQCERTVVLPSAEMRNFSAADCGKATRGNLRNVLHLIFRKLPLDKFRNPHSAKYPRPPYWPQRPYTVYMAVLYTKQGAVKLSQMLMKSIGCHRKHTSAVELLILLLRYKDPIDYKGENGQQ